jgi:hypothetical protein
MGRPKDGENWKNIAAEISNMNTADILSFVSETSELGKAFKRLSPNVQMKWLVLLRVIYILATEPNAGLFNAFLDRVEGKVADRVQMDGGLEVEGLSEMLDKVYGEMEAEH